jgi:hypothetical protein
MNYEVHSSSNAQGSVMKRIKSVCLKSAYLWWILFLSNLIFSPGPTAFAWQEMERPTESAEQAANELAEPLAHKLKAEKVSMIFLDLKRCDSDRIWCEAFSQTLDRQLVRSKILYLPEKEREEMRAKIAEEGLYQSSSMMVDVTKAVALGKQESVGAFVTVTIIGSETDKLVEARSVNIRTGAVTIGEAVRISSKTEGRRSFATYFKGIFGILGGSALLAASTKYAIDERGKADKAYDAYKISKNPEEISSLKRETKKHDNQVSYGYAAGAVGLCIIWYNYAQLTNAENVVQRSYFEVDTAMLDKPLPLQIVASSKEIAIGWSWYK